MSLRIVSEHISNVKTKGFNPPKRTSIARLRSLYQQMRIMGFLQIYPIIIGSDGFVGDGHRRLEVAKRLGYEYVPVVYYDNATSEQIFAIQALGTQTSITGSDLIGCVVDGVIPLGDTNPAFASQYKGIKEMCGNKALKLLAQYSVSPDVITRLRSLLKYIQKNNPHLVITKEFSYKVLEWGITTRQTWRWRTWVAEDKGTEEIFVAMAEMGKLP